MCAKCVQSGATSRRGFASIRSAEVGRGLQVVLPLSEVELRFLTGLLDQGEIDPTLIAAGRDLADTIRLHP